MEEAIVSPNPGTLSMDCLTNENITLQYKILNCSEITPKTGAGYGAVRQSRAA